LDVIVHKFNEFIGRPIESEGIVHKRLSGFRDKLLSGKQTI